MAAIENRLDFYSVSDRGEAYVESSGSYAYMEFPSGITIDSTTRFELDFQLLEVPTDYSVYLFYSGGLYFGIRGSSMKWLAGSNLSNGTFGTPDLNRHVASFDGTAFKLDSAVVFTPTELTTSSHTDGRLLYGSLKARVFSLKLWSGSTLVASFVPAYTTYYTMHDLQGDRYMTPAPANAFSGFIPSTSEELICSADNDSILSIHSTEAMSLLGDELSYDTLTATIQQEEIMTINGPYYLGCTGEQYVIIPWYILDDNDETDRGFDLTVEFSNDLTSTKAYQHIFYVDNCCRFQFNRLQQRYEIYIRTSATTGDTLTIPTSALPVDTERHTVKVNSGGTVTVDGTAVFTGLTIYNSRTAAGSLLSVGNWATDSYTGSYPFIGKLYAVLIKNESGRSVLFDLIPGQNNNIFGLVRRAGSLFFRSSSGADFDGSTEVTVTYGDDLQVMPYGTPVLHYLDDSLTARLYIEEMKRTGRISFEVLSISGIGLIDRQYHQGNLFSGENFLLVVAEILGDSLEYSVAPELANVAIYGHLPYATRRDNLRQLLFATNAHVFRDSNQKIYFDYLDDSETVDLDDEIIFDGGVVEYPKLATKVTVTEHNYYYLSTVTPVTLFDNTTGYEVNDLLVIFPSSPIYPASLTATGTLTFHHASVNCAYVSGIGTLTGIPYVHATLDLVRIDENSGREESEVTVSDATLVTAVNGEGVADRVADYYFNRYIVKADIKWTGERCGKLYSLTNAFLDKEEAFLVKMEKTISSFIRASCEFVAGVSAGSSGNTFEHYALVTSSGSWTIPSGVTVIRLTLIGGGTGGYSGLKGKDGSDSNGGLGGDAGNGGNGGRIYVVTLSDVSGSLTISIGTGGAGAAACSSEQTPNAGIDGNPTTVTYNGKTYTSSAGPRSPAGVKNIFTDDTYALPGDSGLSGAQGGDGLEGQSAAGYPVDSMSGGLPGSSAQGLNSQTSGGAGGGASATTAGSPGGNATVVRVERDTSSEVFDYYDHTPGPGGNGASATKRTTASVYGSGGDGGHGGGGGGGRGVFNGTGYDYTDTPPGSGSIHYKFGDFRSATEVSPGTGAPGGAGGDGAPGCVLIYY